MKKIILVLISLFLLTGCTDLMNTPTKRVEEYLGKYQTMDSLVTSELDDLIDSDITLNSEGKSSYKKALKRQYQNLSYKIKDETYEGSNASVEVEIEVYNYKKANDDADSYVLSNQNDFLNEDGTLNNEKVSLYKFDKMCKTTEKIKYTIIFSLTKESNKWTLDTVSSSTISKIHGIY